MQQRNQFWNYANISLSFLCSFQKHPSGGKGFLIKSYSENMQQIYRRTPMPKCDFSKVAKQIYWNYTSAWVFSCKICCIFSEHFFKRTPLDGYFWISLLSAALAIFLFLLFDIVHTQSFSLEYHKSQKSHEFHESIDIVY